MVTVGLLIRLEAKPGKEADVAEFLLNAVQLVLDEPATTAWFTFRLGKGSFGIFAAFADDDDSQAHLSVRLAAALQAGVGNLLSTPPVIERLATLAFMLADELGPPPMPAYFQGL